MSIELREFSASAFLAIEWLGAGEKQAGAPCICPQLAAIVGTEDHIHPDVSDSAFGRPCAVQRLTPLGLPASTLHLIVARSVMMRIVLADSVCVANRMESRTGVVP